MRPVLILCSPRTGSSMVAQIFWRHGCWVDNDSIRYSNAFGYTSYENRGLKAVAREQWNDYNRGREKIFGEPMEPTTAHLRAVADYVRTSVRGSPWMFKTSAEMYRLFVQFAPAIVLVRRDEDRAVESMAAKQRARRLPVDEDEIRAIHRRRMALMAAIEAEHGAVWVNTDELIDGRYDSIAAAVRFAGLEYDERLVEASIDPGKWNFAA